MTARERLVFWLLVCGRAVAGVLDLAGILAIGYLATSTAVFLSQGTSNAGKRVLFLGADLPAITSGSLPFFAFLILFLFLSKAVISISLTYAIAIHLAKIEARAAAAIASRIFEAGLTAVQKRSTDEVTYAVQIGSTAMFTGFLNNVSTILSEGFLFLLIVIGLLFVNPLATLAVIVYFGFLAFSIQVVVGRGLSKSSKVIAESTVKTFGTIGDLYVGYREIVVAGKVSHFITDLHKARLAATRSIGKQVYLLGMPRYIIETALIFGICAFGLVQLVTGNIVDSAATFGVILTGGMRIIAAMLPWQTALASLKQNIPLASSAVSILNEPLEPRKQVDHEDLLLNSNEPASISIDNVSFSYVTGDREVVSNLTLMVNPGSQIALIGESGAGKSTVVDLIAGLIEPSRGLVKINGVRARDYVQDHPGAVAYVPQRPGMVLGTLLDNIVLGQSNPDLVRVTAALKLADLEDLVAQLPEGLNTDLGQHRDSLSGGQLQRIGIARAFYSNCKLLILDEATSGLDAHSELVISKSLESLAGQVTIVMVAHRLHTVQNSEVVHYLRNGSVEASGTFDQLLETNPQIAESVEISRIRGIR